MNLRKALPFVLGPILTYSGCAGINAYFHHNVETNDRGYKSFEKIDGAFDHTSLSFRGNNVTLNRRGFNYRLIEDNDSDGKVDRVFLAGNPFVRGSNSQSFDRDSDFNDNPAIFENADKELREQLDRFGLDFKGNRTN